MGNIWFLDSANVATQTLKLKPQNGYQQAGFLSCGHFRQLSQGGKVLPKISYSHRSPLRS